MPLFRCRRPVCVCATMFCLTGTQNFAGQCLCRKCTQLLQKGAASQLKPASFIKAWLTEKHLPICTALLISEALQNHQRGSICLGSAAPDVPSKFLESGLRFGDIEWFSRAAMLQGVLQVCTGCACWVYVSYRYLCRLQNPVHGR